MKHAEIERRVLHLWTSTNVPVTAANVQAYTGASRDAVVKALDVMASAGVVELDSDDDGNLLYRVPGAARIPRGATTVGEVLKLEQLRKEVGPAHLPAVRNGGGDEKSVVVSGLLSFFLGPFGLLYAAPIVEAVVPILVLVALSTVVPQSILSPVLGALLPVFGVAGAVYAHRHNKHGRRMSLLPPKKTTKLLR